MINQNRRKNDKKVADSIKKAVHDIKKESENKPSIWEEHLSEETKEWLIKVGTISAIVAGAIICGPYLMNKITKNVLAFKQLKQAIKT